MKSMIVSIFLLVISFNSSSQAIELKQSSYAILKSYVNDQNCSQSRRAFYGCIAAINKLALSSSTPLYLAQDIDEKLYLTTTIGVDGTKYYKVNLHSKYFLKALVEDFYSQESNFSFDKILQNIYYELKFKDLLNVLNGYYAFRYDFHSYLSLDQSLSQYSLPLTLKKIGESTYIQFVPPYTVATYQRVKKGDKIIKVNGVSTARLSEPELRSLGIFDQSSFVTLDVQRDHQSWKVYFTTTKNAFRQKQLDSRSTYFRIEKINDQTYQMILNSLSKNPVERVILDLRSVDGGYVESALNIAALFMHESPWVKLYDITSSEKSLIEIPHQAQNKYKLLILVDEETKSAAEMLAGLVATNDKALIIGKKTYGKGSVQKSKTWAFSESIKEWRTFAFYRLPEWGKIQGYGLEVDIELGDEIPGSKREGDYHLSLADKGVEINDYLNYPLRRSFMRSIEIDCLRDSLKPSQWPTHKTKDRVLETAISGLDCLW